MAVNIADTWVANTTGGMDNVTHDSLHNVTDVNPDDGASGAKFPLEVLVQHGLYVAGKKLLSSQIIICCAIGLPSNLASIVTLLKMKPKTSSMFFLILLAFVDFFTLFYKQLFSILIADLQLRVSEAGCKVYFYIGSLSVHYSIWIMVALTVERFIAVWIPLKVATICTLRRAKMTSVVMLIILALLDLPYGLAAAERQLASGRWNCGIHSSYGSFMTKWAWVDSAIYSFIPWPTLLFCNGMIIIGLRMSARRKEKMTNSSGQSEETKRQQQSITIMLVTASVACFLFLTPNAIFFIYDAYWESGADIENYVAYIFVNSMVYFLANFNHAINFWLYVVSGRRFRWVFLAWIRCRSTDEALRSRTSGVTAVSSVSNVKPKSGVENGGFNKDEENKL